jgi:hypothetical protein
MKEDVADLFVALTISNQPVAGSIIVSARRDSNQPVIDCWIYHFEFVSIQCVLAGVLIVY